MAERQSSKRGSSPHRSPNGINPGTNAQNGRSPKICALCGEAILRRPANPDDDLSMDHVPPKQFYPEHLRKDSRLNLWTVPTHRRCNQAFRQDEEYFYHAMFAVVRDNNNRMGAIIRDDLYRRTKNPQTPAMMRSLLKRQRTVTEGGIILPPGIVQFSLDSFRLQRVALKIAQGLLYRDRSRFFSRDRCSDLQLCLSFDEIPELHELSWEGSKAPKGSEVRRGKGGPVAVLPAVFSYRLWESEGVVFLSMLFWESLMFCSIFDTETVGPTSEKIVKARIARRLSA